MTTGHGRFRAARSAIRRGAVRAGSTLGHAVDRWKGCRSAGPAGARDRGCEAGVAEATDRRIQRGIRDLANVLDSLAPSPGSWVVAFEDRRWRNPIHVQQIVGLSQFWVIEHFVRSLEPNMNDPRWRRNDDYLEALVTALRQATFTAERKIRQSPAVRRGGLGRGGVPGTGAIGTTDSAVVRGGRGADGVSGVGAGSAEEPGAIHAGTGSCG